MMYDIDAIPGKTIETLRDALRQYFSASYNAKYMVKELIQLNEELPEDIIGLAEWYLGREFVSHIIEHDMKRLTNDKILE